jgi:hypothetical protein
MPGSGIRILAEDDHLHIIEWLIKRMKYPFR